MRKVRYDYWADYIYSITNHIISPKPKVLELAAGNCQLAHFLSAYYEDYTCTDLSLAMLNNSKYEIDDKVCCDMRMLPFKVKFDLIVSAFDSINYLLYKNDIKKLFNEVHRSLSDKGIFTFDVSLEQNSYKHIKDPTRHGSYKGIKYRQETSFDPSTKLHSNIFYVTGLDGSVKKEIHRQKIYSFETYFELIESSYMVVKECFDAFTYKNAKPNSSRIQFITCKK